MKKVQAILIPSGALCIAFLVIYMITCTYTYANYFLLFYILVTAIFITYKKLYNIQTKKISYLMLASFISAIITFIASRSISYSRNYYMSSILLISSFILFALYFFFKAAGTPNKNLKSISLSYLLFTVFVLFALEVI